MTPSTSMSALARQCLNVFSPAIARRWTPASVPLRRLTTNNAPADDPLLWDKLLDTTNSPAVRKKLTGQSPDDAWLAQHKRTISSLVPPNNAYSGMPLTHSLPTPAHRLWSQVEALRSKRILQVLLSQPHIPPSLLGLGRTK